MKPVGSALFALGYGFAFSQRRFDPDLQFHNSKTAQKEKGGVSHPKKSRSKLLNLKKRYCSVRGGVGGISEEDTYLI